MNEFVLVITFDSFPMLRLSKDNCKAEFPELTEIAYLVPMYLANSYSNLATLSPITNFSFFNASIAVFSMSFVNSGTKRFTFSAFDVVTC